MAATAAPPHHKSPSYTQSISSSASSSSLFHSLIKNSNPGFPEKLKSIIFKSVSGVKCVGIKTSDPTTFNLNYLDEDS